MPVPQPTMPDLDTLVGLFYDRPEELGQFEEVAADAMPETYRTLLAHEEHMTVTVEAFHRSQVDVQVLARLSTPIHYARKILLRRQSDRQVVQFGIMRVKLAFLEAVVREKIVGEQIPLGRVLIDHNVLRQVRLSALWRVAPGVDLCRMFGQTSPRSTYGRTAMIDCNGEPAIELLEIVTAVGD
jgi:hypothetical protein